MQDTDAMETVYTGFIPIKPISCMYMSLIINTLPYHPKLNHCSLYNDHETSTQNGLTQHKLVSVNIFVST
jgi:hypothetical protein